MRSKRPEGWSSYILLLLVVVKPLGPFLTQGHEGIIGLLLNNTFIYQITDEDCCLLVDLCLLGNCKELRFNLFKACHFRPIFVLLRDLLFLILKDLHLCSSSLGSSFQHVDTDTVVH